MLALGAVAVAAVAVAVAVILSLGAPVPARAAVAGPTQRLVTAREPMGAAGGASCSTRTETAPRLGKRLGWIRVSTQPFGVAITRNGRFVFAGLTNALGVYVRRGDRLRRRATITLPEEALGVALSPNGRYLLAADGTGGAYVLDVAAAERGSQSAVMGQITSTGSGAIEVAVSHNGEFAFVTLENSNELAVYNLKRALASRFTKYRPVRMIPLGRGPVGVSLSPDGRYLYATSELGSPSGEGTLFTVDVSRAVTGSEHAIVSSVPAGCEPVRVAAAGGSVYVTARESDSVLWYSSRALARGPARVLEGSVRVGPEPVGLGIVDGGRGILVADSNRFDSSQRANLALLRLASDGRPVLQGYLRAGSFPRDIAVTDDGRYAVVANFGSYQLESVTLSPT